LNSAPQPAVSWWSRSDEEPVVPVDPRLVEQDLRRVARVLRDLEASV